MVENCSLKCNFIGAILSLLGGLAGFFTFMPLGNYHAGIWSLLSAVMTAFNLHIHFLNLRGRLEQVYTQDRLKITGFLGIFMAFAGFIAALTYLVISLVNSIPFFPIETSMPLAALQGFVTFKESATLAYFSRKHFKNLTNAVPKNDVEE